MTLIRQIFTAQMICWPGLDPAQDEEVAAAGSLDDFTQDISVLASEPPKFS